MKKYKGQITEEYDNAIVGATLSNRLVYSFSKMIEIEANSYDDTDYEDEFGKLDAAREFLEFNFMRWLDYQAEDEKPIVLYQELSEILDPDSYDDEGLKKALLKWFNEDESLYLEGYDRAILGNTQHDEIIYDYEKMCSITSKTVVDKLVLNNPIVIIIHQLSLD